jgi:hypothetical protein
VCLLKDPVDYPPDYDDWRKLNEAAEWYWISRGARVARVSVDLEGFLAWCAKRHIKPNSKALEVCIDERLEARCCFLEGSP